MDRLLTTFIPAIDAYGLSLSTAWAFAAGALGLLVLAILRRPSRSRPVILLTVTLAVAAGGAYLLSRAIADITGDGRFAVLRAMHERPRDPWPRGSAHVPLGAFGSTEREKGYLEPGGSFSPAAGTFGISFWIVDQAGALLATSDSIPLQQTSASYLIMSGEPGIVVETPYYSATWTAQGAVHYRLALVSRAPPGSHVEIVFRGVGPAAGPLRTVQLDGATLSLNRQWTIGPLAPEQISFFGIEGGADWTRPMRSAPRTAVSDTGWATARFSIPQSATLDLSAIDSTQVALAAFGDPARLKLSGVDPRFERSLRSQVVTLQMGIVGDETRPGDPLNYPLQWLRDGAYFVVALARAGHTQLAQRLAMKFAHDDFFGGFGAEGDGPGLALWTLAEVSALSADPGFDAMIWPDVQRKVALIQRLVRTTSEIRHGYSGPIVPEYRSRSDLDLVAGPSRSGLINGRMDLHHPIFYVTSTDYAGLVGAARIAGRLGERATAIAWSGAAEELQRAWRTAFAAPDWQSDVANERTAISGLWPSEIAAKPAYADLLERRWKQNWPTDTVPAIRPLWTYFTVAEAHQWLRLDRPDRVWLTLDWLWDQQPMPGLFTSWEGSKEENDFGLWRRTRGWIKPPYVTPHYWTAAEMLLLQLEMLAEGQGGGIVIGAGVPAEWLTHDLSISGVGTSHGFVDWTWDGSEAVVTLHGDVRPVRLGPAFPSAARLSVKTAGAK